MSAIWSGMVSPTSTWSRRYTSSAAREIARTIFSRLNGTTNPSRLRNPSKTCCSTFSMSSSSLLAAGQP